MCRDQGAVLLLDDAVRAASLIVSVSALVELVEEVCRMGGGLRWGGGVQWFRPGDGRTGNDCKVQLMEGLDSASKNYVWRSLRFATTVDGQEAVLRTPPPLRKCQL